jgi:hypothetical protein
MERKIKKGNINIKITIAKKIKKSCFDMSDNEKK